MTYLLLNTRVIVVCSDPGMTTLASGFAGGL